MPRILYPALQGPIQLEQISSRWQAPLSRPTLRVALTTAVIASGCFFSNFVPAPSLATWHRPLSEPVRFRAIQTAAIPQPFEPDLTAIVAITSVDRWHAPLSLPNRAQFRQPIPTQVAIGYQVLAQQFVAPAAQLTGPTYTKTVISRTLSYTGAEPFARGATPDQWWQQFSVPVRRGGLPAAYNPAFSIAGRSGFSGTGIGLDQPWPPFSEPWRNQLARKPVAFNLANIYVPQPIGAVSADAFYAAFSTPQRFPPRGLPTNAQKAAFLVQAAPFGENIKTEAFLGPLSAPLRYRSGLGTEHQQDFFYAGAAPFGEVLVSSSWYAPISTPVRVPLKVVWQQPFTWNVAPVAGDSVDAWWRPLSEPQRFPVALKYHLHQSTFLSPPFAPFEGGGAADPGRWFTKLSEPFLKRQFLATAEQRATFYVGAAPFPEQTTPSRWYAPFGVPVRGQPLTFRQTFPSWDFDQFVTPPVSPPPPPPPPNPAKRARTTVSGRLTYTSSRWRHTSTRASGRRSKTTVIDDP